MASSRRTQRQTPRRKQPPRPNEAAKPLQGAITKNGRKSSRPPSARQQKQQKQTRVATPTKAAKRGPQTEESETSDVEDVAPDVEFLFAEAFGRPTPSRAVVPVA